MDLSPTQIGQLVQLLGVVGVLLVVVFAFLRDWVMTKAAVDRLIAATGAGKDQEILRLERQVSELTRVNEAIRETTIRNSGSQATQLTVVTEAMAVITQLAIKLQNGARSASPPTSAP